MTRLLQWTLGLSLVFIGACVVTTVPDSRVLGECKELIVEHHLALANMSRAFSEEHILSPEQFSSPHGEVVFVGKVPAGTRVLVQDVLRNPRIMSFGGPTYLRVVVRILDGDFSGMLADVPACVPHHPRPRWVTNCTLEPNALQFNPAYVKHCHGKSSPGP